MGFHNTGYGFYSQIFFAKKNLKVFMSSSEYAPEFKHGAPTTPGSTMYPSPR
jgi:hypothetical protein